MADLVKDTPSKTATPGAVPADGRVAADAPTPATPGANHAASGPRPARWMWQGKIPEAFWKTATLLSFVVNLSLLIALITVGLMLFRIKNAIAQPLVAGLHTSFVQMDSAHIVSTIQVHDTIHVIDTIHVNDTIPVVFNAPLSTNTTVVLNHDTAIHNTTVYLNGLPVPTDIVLPAGTPLDISLNLIVPVSQTVPVVLDVPVSLSVPVSLTVPVDIPLSQTELHTPFTGLANLVGPYDALLAAAPSSWSDLFGRR